jgi:hypothetical protein
VCPKGLRRQSRVESSDGDVPRGRRTYHFDSMIVQFRYHTKQCPEHRRCVGDPPCLRRRAEGGYRTTWHLPMHSMQVCTPQVCVLQVGTFQNRGVSRAPRRFALRRSASMSCAAINWASTSCAPARQDLESRALRRFAPISSAPERSMSASRARCSSRPLKSAPTRLSSSRDTCCPVSLDITIIYLSDLGINNLGIRFAG